MENTKNVYREAAASGKYEKVTGLLGKYDNVRRYWEDELSRMIIRPHIERIIEEKRRKMERLRILDLGCGSGDGYEFLIGAKANEPGLVDHQVNLITPEILGLYHGIDISEPLLQQAREVHGEGGKIRFDMGDFSHGLPDCVEDGYDIYFSFYATLSHLKDEQLVELLADIASRCKKGAVIICDWLGRYSYEWQSLWQLEEEPDYAMDYVMDYIYSEDERQEMDLEHLILRLISPREVEELAKEASRRCKVNMKLRGMYDRSIFVGRHMDTRNYNRFSQPLRGAVNSLFETNLRTNLDTLIADYYPLSGFDEVNSFFEAYQMSWNSLVRFTIDLLYHYDSGSGKHAMPEIHDTYPEIVREMMGYILNIVKSCHWIKVGDTRANIIEPQLGYALRELAMKMQRGLGCGHGLVAIFEVQ